MCSAYPLPRLGVSRKLPIFGTKCLPNKKDNATFVKNNNKACERNRMKTSINEDKVRIQ